MIPLSFWLGLIIVIGLEFGLGVTIRIVQTCGFGFGRIRFNFLGFSLLFLSQLVVVQLGFLGWLDRLLRDCFGF